MRSPGHETPREEHDHEHHHLDDRGPHHHRHRGLDLKIPTVRGQALVFTVQGWQLKSSAFTWRATGVRQAVPQLGLTILKWNRYDGPWTRHFTRFAERSREV